MTSRFEFLILLIPKIVVEKCSKRQKQFRNEKFYLNPYSESRIYGECYKFCGCPLNKDFFWDVKFLLLVHHLEKNFEFENYAFFSE